MPPLTRTVSAAFGVLVLVGLFVLSGCGGDDDGAGRAGTSVTLAPNTCWTAATLGADPQRVLALAQAYGVDYFAAAQAVDRRPAFQLTESCKAPHHVEVYKVVPVAQVTPTVTSYATFLQHGQRAYNQVVAAVENACMGETLAEVARLSKVPGAVVEPAFPEGVELGWAPPSPEQWDKGQRTYACTLTSATPVRYRYAAVFTKAFPTGERTCITNSPLLYVDCARKHNRERILVIDVRAAVAAGTFPGTRAIRVGSRGKFVQVPASTLATLDRACTAYLRAISTTDRLTGVAEIDAERWPAKDGSYPVDCEADVEPTKSSITTEGSVFDK